MIVDLTKYASEKDIGWLQEQLRRNRISQRQIAKATGLDPSSLSRSLAGNRRMSMTEFATALGFIETYRPGTETPLQKAYWQARVSVNDLAHKTRLTVPRVTNLLRGIGSAATDDEESRLARALGMTMPASNEDMRSANASPPPRQPLADADGMGDDIPAYISVLAAPVPLGRGYYQMPQALVEKRVRPQSLRGVPGAFAFFLGDEGFVPRWYPGEIVFIHPGRPIVPGRWMLFETKDERMTMGRVMSRRDGAIQLERPGQPGTEALPEADIATAGDIVGSWAG